MRWKELHVSGKRKEVPLCSYCHFWGVPTGSDHQSDRRSEEQRSETRVFEEKQNS
jgi:hypothetical protein